MLKDIENNENGNVSNGIIIIATKNYYLFYALKTLITSMSPDLLSKTSMLYDVINVKDILTLETFDAAREKNNILITDYDFRLCSHEQIKRLRNITRSFRGIACITSSSSMDISENMSIPQQSGIRIVRTLLFDIIATITTACTNRPEEMLNFLTPSEAQLLKLIMVGMRPDTIARQLQINVKTFYALRSRLYRKTGVRSLQELYNHFHQQQSYLPVR